MKRIYGSIFVSILALFLVLSVTPAAKAAEAGPFYVGIFGGYVMPDDAKIEGPGGSVDLSLDNSWALGFKGGYIIPQAKWLAVELEYAYLAEQDVDQPGASGSNFSAHNLMANLLLRYPEGKIHPYIGFGIGWSWGTFHDPGQDFDDNAFAWQILAGVNFEISPSWSADIGYKYFTSKYEPFDNTSVDATVKNHMFLIGVNYHF